MLPALPAPVIRIRSPIANPSVSQVSAATGRVSVAAPAVYVTFVPAVISAPVAGGAVTPARPTSVHGPGGPTATCADE